MFATNTPTYSVYIYCDFSKCGAWKSFVKDVITPFWKALLRLLERHYNAFLISKRQNNALLCLFRVITPFRKALHVKRLLNIFSVRNLILIGFRRYLFRNCFSILIEITHVTAEWCPINSRHPWVESCVIYLHKSTLRSPACYDIFS